MFHQERDCIAVSPAAETVINLLLRTHRERGGLLAMERAEPEQVVASRLEVDSLSDNVDYVGDGQQPVDEILGEFLGSFGARAGRRDLEHVRSRACS